MKAGQSVEGLNMVTGALAKARQTESRTYEAELYESRANYFCAGCGGGGTG